MIVATRSALARGQRQEYLLRASQGEVWPEARAQPAANTGARKEGVPTIDTRSQPREPVRCWTARSSSSALQPRLRGCVRVRRAHSVIVGRAPDETSTGSSDEQTDKSRSAAPARYSPR